MNKHKGLLILAVVLGVMTLSASNSANSTLAAEGVKKVDADEKAIEELADEVIRGEWGNNPDRKEDMIAAGYDYEAVQELVNEKMDAYTIHEPVTAEELAVTSYEPVAADTDTTHEPVAAEKASEPEATPHEPSTTAKYSLRDLQYHGVIHWGGYKWTYYSQQVLPGNGLNIPGRHVSSSGYVCDGDGYIVLAAPSSWGNVKGTVYSTPFGAPGKVYDVNAGGDSLDVYTR